MGSMLRTSRPFEPQYTTPVYTPPAVETDAPTQGGGTEDQDRAESIARQIARNRGRASTILTSFRGVLDKRSSLAPQRKNLLGE